MSSVIIESYTHSELFDKDLGHEDILIVQWAVIDNKSGLIEGSCSFDLSSRHDQIHSADPSIRAMILAEMVNHTQNRIIGVAGNCFDADKIAEIRGAIGRSIYTTIYQM